MSNWTCPATESNKGRSQARCGSPKMPTPACRPEAQPAVLHVWQTHLATVWTESDAELLRRVWDNGSIGGRTNV